MKRYAPPDVGRAAGRAFKHSHNATVRHNTHDAPCDIRFGAHVKPGCITQRNQRLLVRGQARKQEARADRLRFHCNRLGRQSWLDRRFYRTHERKMKPG